MKKMERKATKQTQLSYLSYYQLLRGILGRFLKKNECVEGGAYH